MSEMDWKTVPMQATHNMLVAARRPNSHGERYRAMVEAAPTAPPINMILHCPKCHTQHIDAPDTNYDPHYEGHMIWHNPPHRSHLCHQCGTIWRPADVCTNGVASLTTRGKSDTGVPTC